MRVERLQPFGVAISHIDLRTELTSAVRQELDDLFRDQMLLVVRGQDLSGPQHVDFMTTFGPVVDEIEDGTFTSMVSNVDSDAYVRDSDELLFHSDMSFAEAPPWITSLYGLEVSGGASPTQFVNMERVLPLLDRDLLESIGQRTAVDMANFSGSFDALLRPLRGRLDDLPHDLPRNKFPRSAHPIISAHPRLHRRVLYVSERTTVWVEGLSRDDSNRLLDRIFDAAYRPENQYVHEWHVGDLVVWDQFGVQHARRHLPVGCIRRLRRVTIADRTTRQVLKDVDHFIPSK